MKSIRSDFQPSFISNRSHLQTSIQVLLHPGLFSLSMTENPSGLFLQDLFSSVAGFLAECYVINQSCSFRNVCFWVLPCLNRTDPNNSTG